MVDDSHKNVKYQISQWESGVFMRNAWYFVRKTAVSYWEKQVFRGIAGFSCEELDIL
jgi:hypothetical protein